MTYLILGYVGNVILYHCSKFHQDPSNSLKDTSQNRWSIKRGNSDLFDIHTCRQPHSVPLYRFIKISQIDYKISVKSLEWKKVGHSDLLYIWTCRQFFFLHHYTKFHHNQWKNIEVTEVIAQKVTGACQ